MLAQGVTLRVVQEVLGHSTIGITADIYTHLAPTAVRDATERVGAALWDGSDPVAVNPAVNGAKISRDVEETA